MSQPKIIDRDKGWRDLLKRVHKLSDGMHTRVGAVGDKATDANGKATNALVMLANEYGTTTIPQRSFIGATFDKLRTDLENRFNEFGQAYIDGKFTDVKQPFNVIGLYLATEIRKYVTAGSQVPPPNTPSVYERKRAKGKGGEPRTLIDTAQMINALTWVVEKGLPRRK